ncbi:MAG: protein kinase [Planctomycetota bacterium]|nr:protein kinase [Planctomycetota bacterium]
MSSAPGSIPEQLGPYRIEALIGRGGMGVVYRAVDTRLDRLVALKVLAEQFASDEHRLARFEREAKAVAALNHPGIVTIHSVEEDQGQKFIVMELVEGKPLSAEIVPGGATLARLLDLMLPIADALSVAHKAGVTHRDLKPENIMVCDDGQVKVLDFGLAKMSGESTSTSVAETDVTVEVDANVTREGQIIGTPSYMSPEQAEGKEVDGRTDVFSFGILLYELATGVRPFQGDTPMSTLTSVLRDTPVPMAELKPSLPRYLGRIISRCLEKSPERRYQTTVDLRNELEQLHSEVSTGELQRPLPVEPVARKRSKMPMVASVLLLVVAAVGFGLFSGFFSDMDVVQPEMRRDAIAVVGFSNINDPADEENLGAILSNLITSDLSSAGGLTVVSQPRVAHARELSGQGKDVVFDFSGAGKVARRAGAGVMVVGTVSRLGEKYIVTAEAIQVEDGTSLISGKEEASQADELFALASRLSNVLRVGLGQSTSSEQMQFDAKQQFTASAAAYRNYIRGTSALHVRRYKEAIEKLKEAVETDPTFARAALDLGIALWWNGNDDKCLAAIETGFAHISRLPKEEQKIYRAFHDLLSADGYPNQAIRLLEELEADGSENPAVYYLLGECYTHAALVTDFDRAMGLFLRALELDPTYQVVFFHLMEGFIRSGRIEDGHAFLDELAKDEPDAPSILSARSTLLFAQNKIQETLAVIEKLQAGGGNPAGMSAACYGLLGDREKMDEYEKIALDRSEGHNKTVERLFRKMRRVKAGRFIDAENEWELAWEDHPGDRTSSDVGDNFHQLVAVEHACTLLIRGDIEQGIEILELFRKRNKYSRLPLYWLGHLMVEAGQIDAARSVMEDLQASVQGEDAPYIIGKVLLLQALIDRAEGNSDAALEKMEAISEISVLNRDYGPEQIFLARLHAEAGDLTAAVAALREARKPVSLFRAPAALTIDALYQLAVLEQEIGEAGSARTHFEEFLGHWGEADIPLESVEDARKRLQFLNSQ